mmetsp:Transcript_17379/g.42518  ORF Transcript_17379/g.42518 Transcript_17379/m.42518 type:complete len:231 (+) Transcript_17379:31-723(+)
MWNMMSASSITMNPARLNDSLCSLSTSSSLPGEVTRQWVPFRSIFVCLCLLIPPKRMAHRMPHGSAALFVTRKSWAASSLVGAMITERGPRVCSVVPSSASLCIRMSIGSTNASVFPDPVSATATTSLPARSTGQVWAWMGIGALNSLTAGLRAFGRRSSWKVVRGLNALRSSDTLTACLERHCRTSSAESVLMPTASGLRRMWPAGTFFLTFPEIPSTSFRPLRATRTE